MSHCLNATFVERWNRIWLSQAAGAFSARRALTFSFPSLKSRALLASLFTCIMFESGFFLGWRGTFTFIIMPVAQGFTVMHIYSQDNISKQQKPILQLWSQNFTALPRTFPVFPAAVLDFPRFVFFFHPWAAPLFPLCIALWYNRVYQEHDCCEVADVPGYTLGTPRH